MLLAKLAAAVRRHRMVEAGDRVLVACSGGPDSTALLDAFVRLRGRLQIEIEAAAVDHGLRPEAPAECERVRAAAAALGVPCQVLRAGVLGPSQDAARRARLDLLAACARERGCRRIALGHTRGDQAETVLMRMIRGAGARGLAGIPPVRGPFVRPLLDVSREEIEEYLRERRLPCVRDPSNQDRRYLRVRVRRELLPWLRNENPRIEEALATLAANLREERGETVTPPLTRAHLRALADALGAPGGTRILHLPDRRVAEVRVGVGPRAREPLPPSAPVEVAVPGPGRHAAAPLGTLVIERGGEGTRFDPAALRFPLTARTRRPGDRIRLPGGTRKLQDVLCDAKVPRPDRDRVLLLCKGDRLLWVAGVAQAAGTKPRGARFLAVRVE